ncbi:hypothetical protein [Paenibacillus sp. R14(2021)]|uniref:hypothetical protein n=1 Tax=Paenibacillus sp. R14(2021) TaxID=2859228 RepID=UPI001C611C07|nr:hypothetical protein [Paenibacillus sp. R14(2021)]
MKPRTKLKKILLGVGAFFILAYLIAGGFIWYKYHSVKQTATTMFEPIIRPVYASTYPEVKLKSAPVKLSDKEPFTVPLVGIDHRANDHGRSDTMIVLSVNPAKKTILMF